MSRVLVGFTGTREGMTEAQAESLFTFLRTLNNKAAIKILHGACIGADEEVAKFAKSENIPTEAFPGFKVGHPMRSLYPADVLHDVKPPLQRNEDIVTFSDVVFGCPKEETIYTKRSGTCWTIRHAMKTHTPTYVVFPSGQMAKYFPGEKNATKPSI